ncbi:glycine zipper domain-containing protein [Niveibacterium sp. SC-1]|uniref:glycine zipper domain-containing protein n=1 Tax=Niveibacterium sp. SC-1 TaxID=3135646 RepID=UPI00311EB1C9
MTARFPSARRALAAALLPLLVPAFTGCATVDDKTQSAGIGAALGCAAGAVLAKVTDNDMATACAAGAVIGGIIGYQKARNAEIEQANQAAQAVTAVPGAKPAPVQTEQVAVKDKSTGKTEQVAAFKSVSVDIPASQINTPEGKEALRKLNDYARKVAAERGETVDVTYAANSPDSVKQKVALEKTRETVGKGTVVRNLSYDTQIPKNIYRVSVEVKNPTRVEV